jgi:hypothetical protein
MIFSLDVHEFRMKEVLANPGYSLSDFVSDDAHQSFDHHRRQD